MIVILGCDDHFWKTFRLWRCTIFFLHTLGNNYIIRKLITQSFKNYKQAEINLKCQQDFLFIFSARVKHRIQYN